MAIKIRLILGLLLVTFVLGCQNENGIGMNIPEGGYEFPKQVEDKDTLLYIYPIKDIIPSKDSFDIATYSEFLYKSFNEPNLSLSAVKKPIYRFVYQQGFTAYTAILILEDKKMTIKELENGYAIPYVEKETLDSLERKHLHLFEMYFPLNKYSENQWTKKYLDSMTKIYPKLLDANYYRTLTIKASNFGSEPFSYKKREISLANEKYKYFIDLINQSGYWKMKPIEDNCIGEVTHPDGYILEAATPNKYNFVNYVECMDDSSKFARVIAEIMTYSKLRENERKWNDQFIKNRK